MRRFLPGVFAGLVIVIALLCAVFVALMLLAGIADLAEGIWP